jgi:hypothetical protein
MRALLLMSCLALAMSAPAQAQRSHAIAGDWHGTGLQVGPEGVQSSWTIQLSITAAGAAEIAYPQLGCKSVLHRVTAAPNETVFREEITQGDCIDGGHISVMAKNGRLFWFWTSPGTPADASAVLYPDNLVS